MARKSRAWAPFTQGMSVTAGAQQGGNFGIDLGDALGQSLRGLTVTRILATLEFFAGPLLADGLVVAMAFGVAVGPVGWTAGTVPDPSDAGVGTGYPWMWHMSGMFVPLAAEVAAGTFIRIPFYAALDVRAQRKIGAGETLWIIAHNGSAATTTANLRGRALLLG